MQVKVAAPQTAGGLLLGKGEAQDCARIATIVREIGAKNLAAVDKIQNLSEAFIKLEKESPFSIAALAPRQLAAYDIDMTLLKAAIKIIYQEKIDKLLRGSLSFAQDFIQENRFNTILGDILLSELKKITSVEKFFAELVWLNFYRSNIPQIRAGKEQLCLALADNEAELNAYTKLIVNEKDHSKPVAELFERIIAVNPSFLLAIDIAKFKLTREQGIAIASTLGRASNHFPENSKELLILKELLTLFATNFEEEDYNKIFKVWAHCRAVLLLREYIDLPCLSPEHRTKLIELCCYTTYDIDEGIENYKLLTASWTKEQQLTFLAGELLPKNQSWIAKILTRTAEFPFSKEERQNLCNLAAASVGGADNLVFVLNSLHDFSAEEKYALAKNCAENYIRGGISFASLICSFPFAQEKSKRMELATIATLGGDAVLEHLKTFDEGFSNSDYFSLCKIYNYRGASCNEFKIVFQLFKNFSEEQQLNILEIIAKSNSSQAFDYLREHQHKYHTKYSAYMCDIISACITSDYPALNFNCYINAMAEFNFSREEQVKLAYVWVSSAGRLLIDREKFKINFNTDELFTLTKLSIKNNPSLLNLLAIDSMGFDNTQMVELFKIAIENNRVASNDLVTNIMPTFLGTKGRFDKEQQFDIFATLWQLCAYDHRLAKELETFAFNPQQLFQLAMLRATYHPESAINERRDWLGSQLPQKKKIQVDVMAIQRVDNPLKILERFGSQEELPQYPQFIAALVNKNFNLSRENILQLAHQLELKIEKSVSHDQFSADLHIALSKEANRTHYNHLEIFVAECTAALAYFEGFYAAHLQLSSFHLKPTEAIRTLFTLCKVALRTPNRQIKKDILQMVLAPFARASVDEKAQAALCKPFSKLLRDGGEDTLAVHSYLFALFHHCVPTPTPLGAEVLAVQPYAKINLYTLSKGYDKLFRSLSAEQQATLRQKMLDLLQALHAATHLSVEQKWTLLNSALKMALLKKDQLPGLLEEMAYTRIIASHQRFTNVFAALATHAEESSFSIKQFLLAEITPLLPNFSTAQLAVIAPYWLQKRTTLAFFNYCHSIQALPSVDQQLLMPYFEQFLLAAAAGEQAYNHWKFVAQPELSEQQRRLSLFPEIYQQWQKEIAPYSPIQLQQGAFVAPDYLAIFQRQIIIYGHLTGLAKLGDMARYLKENIVPTAPLQQQDVLTPQQQFQNKVIEFLEKCSRGELKSAKEIKPYLEAQKNLLSRFSPHSEFLNDLEGLLCSLRATHDKPLQLFFTAKPIPLFLCGTEIKGSCQRTDGTPSLNKCLMGYTSPHIGMVALGSEEQLHARAMLKLLFKEEPTPEGISYQPVLFLERAYPVDLDEEKVQLLLQVAQRKAAEMGVPLTTCSEQYLKLMQPVPSATFRLHCYGSKAPFEYCDVLKGQRQGGRYSMIATVVPATA